MTAGADAPIALSLGADAVGAPLTQSDLASAMPLTEIAVNEEVISLNALVGTSAMHTAVTSGPVMSSWVYRHPVSGNAHLVVWAEVRLFRGGAVEIFPWIENGYLTVSDPTNFVRTCSLTIAGVRRFGQSIDIKHHTRVPLVNGTAFSYWSTTDPGVLPRHDTAYVRATKLIPNIAFGAPSGTALDSLPQAFEPNTLAGDTAANGSAGGAGGVISRPSALYLTSGADPRAYRGMLVHALSSGSWSHHFRDESTSLPLAFSAYPTASLASQHSPIIPTGTGGENANGPAMSHAVSYAYLPFILTGRWWFLEELHFWATYAFLRVNYAYRRRSLGVHTEGQPRSRAWSLNVLAQAATITPSAHPLSREFVASWEANVAEHLGKFVNGTILDDGGSWVSPQGFLGDYTGKSDNSSPYVPPTASNAWWTAPWMHHYLSLVFGYSTDMGIPQSPESHAQHVVVRDHGYRHQIGCADDGLGGRFNWRHFTRYMHPVGENSIGLPLETYYTHSQSYAEYLSALGLPALDPAPGGSLKYGPDDIADGTSGRAYLAPGLAALALAAEQQVPGGPHAYARITSASNYASALTNYLTNEAPQWGVTPRPGL